MDAWHTLSRRRLLGLTGGAAVAALAAGPAGDLLRPAEATQTPRIRKNARSLSATERRAFADAILAMKRAPSPWLDTISLYDQFVMWHRDTLDHLIDAAHMRPAFLPWHRMYLLLFERLLQRTNPTINLPYWDWTVDRSPDSDPWHDDFMGGNGSPAANFAVTTGPFARDRWQLVVFDQDDTQQLPHIVRDFGRFPNIPNLPTAAQVDDALRVPTYDVSPWNRSSDITQSFRNHLEGWRSSGPSAMHNAAHLWVAGEVLLAHEPGGPAGPDSIIGTMAFNTSPNDPVFWLHHANIDRLWAQWQRRHGLIYAPTSGGPQGHNIGDRMWPFYLLGLNVSPRAMLDHRTLGYAYESELSEDKQPATPTPTRQQGSAAAPEADSLESSAVGGVRHAPGRHP